MPEHEIDFSPHLTFPLSTLLGVVVFGGVLWALLVWGTVMAWPLIVAGVS